MRTIYSFLEIKTIVGQLKMEGKSIGLVPTMGALHQGHEALIRQSVKDNDITITSIFVNPLQFNNQNDLVNYPKTLSSDLKILEKIKCDIAYCPSEKEMYPTPSKLKIGFNEFSNKLEGEFRPGHFEGVAVIVMKFFNQIQPTTAYFGLKDYQQFLLIKKIVQELSYPIKLVGIPTVREPSGLAMSSRNLKLSADGRKTAASIYQGLVLGKELSQKGKSIVETKQLLMEFYSTIKGLDIEYLEILDENLEDPSENTDTIACIAAYVEGVRLIDNLYLRQD